jgi:hypothetical protein
MIMITNLIYLITKWLRYKQPMIIRPFRVWWGLAIIFILVAIFIIIGNTLELNSGSTDYKCQENAIHINNYIKSVISIGFIILGFIGWYISKP